MMSFNSIFISGDIISARIFAIHPSDWFISIPVNKVSGTIDNSSTINEPHPQPKSANLSFAFIFNKYDDNSVIHSGVVPIILLISQAHQEMASAPAFHNRKQLILLC